MALPKKKSRLITVNNEKYRYVISAGKYNENWEFDLNITVQLATGEGCKLKVKGLITRDYWLDFPNDITSKEDYPVLTPLEISIIITCSLKSGWNPELKGKPYIININNNQISNDKNNLNRFWIG
ncbi:hypothetical protein RM697_12900 [Ichthyenterobacterium sp. W332]|uniref:Uncharacterized protein n=1 Tax=Microcosmobacter mediterraneus TaxID=3075607 RepID=A0ABU2YQK9_9FLAO|nr:hypothetical protein [Ichthyenterobacterium sp. W332]MDT0559555.1 hypothetical protein [Ichthyenterobacterium sp. W332]